MIEGTSIGSGGGDAERALETVSGAGEGAGGGLGARTGEEEEVLLVGGGERERRGSEGELDCKGSEEGDS